MKSGDGWEESSAIVMRTEFWFVFNVLSLFLVCSIDADFVVFDSGVGGADGVSGGFISDESFESGGSFPRRVADDFLISESETITGITWSGLYAFENSPPRLDNFTIDVYVDNGNVPPADGVPFVTLGPPVASFNVGNEVNRVDSGFDLLVVGNVQLDVYEFEANINFDAKSDERYWLSIYNDTTGDQDDFYWGGAGGAGEFLATADGGNSWLVGSNFVGDFQLTAVPESATGVFVLACTFVLFCKRNDK